MNQSFHWRRFQNALLLLICIAIAGLALINVRLALSQDAAVLVSPPTQTVNPGQLFTTDIVVSDITNLQGADIDMTYNNAVLEFVSYTNGLILTSEFSSSPLCSAGSCNYVAVRIGPSFSGSGTLFTITWRAQANGSSPIDILSSQFSDNNGQAISVTSSDGSVTVGTPSPTATATATATATQTATATATATSTATATATATASPTVTPTGTATGTPTVTPTSTPTSTPTGTPTGSPPGTPTGSPPGTPTSTPTGTPTSTPTATPTVTPTPTPAPDGLLIKQQLRECLAVTNIAWGHDNETKGWFGFDPTVFDSLQTLTAFVPGGGYVVNLNADCTIDWGVNHIELHTGWNLFGWN
jgi:hypothetical protein